MNDVYDEIEYEDGTKDFIFNKEKALGLLIFFDVVDVLDYFSEDDCQTYIFGIKTCYVFDNLMGGVSICLDEIEDLYNEWLKHKIYGPIVWIMKKKKLRPVKKIFDEIQELGIWDLNLFDYE